MAQCDTSSVAVCDTSNLATCDLQQCGNMCVLQCGNLQVWHKQCGNDSPQYICCWSTGILCITVCVGSAGEIVSNGREVYQLKQCIHVHCSVATCDCSEWANVTLCQPMWQAMCAHHTSCYSLSLSSIPPQWCHCPAPLVGFPTNIYV